MSEQVRVRAEHWTPHLLAVTVCLLLLLCKPWGMDILYILYIPGSLGQMKPIQTVWRLSPIQQNVDPLSIQATTPQSRCASPHPLPWLLPWIILFVAFCSISNLLPAMQEYVQIGRCKYSTCLFCLIFIKHSWSVAGAAVNKLQPG